MAENAIIHFEVVGRDGQALQRFYGELFGWQFDTSNPGGYGISSADRTGVAVGVGSTPDGSPGHVTGYVAVADIDSALAQRVDASRERGGR